VAAKAGGDPDYNISLKNAIEKAKSINMPNDNINRAIKKGTGELAGETYEARSYEGYGAGGVAVIVEILTDNRNRTTAAIKHAFDRFGGNLGTPGCVSYMFDRKGVILIEKTAAVDEDALMEAALDAGMEDMIEHEDSFEIRTSPESFDGVAEALRAAKYELAEADVEYVPSLETTPSEPDLKNLAKMIELLEDNDDVQKVYTNCAAL
jgi:YebC/PmpR family DNA-binding regulatory protein